MISMVAARPRMWNSSTGARSIGRKRARSTPAASSAESMAATSFPGPL